MLMAMFLLNFLVVLTVGILKPIRNVLALDGLAPGDFYQTYFFSAIVILFAPIYNRLADRIPFKQLIPGVAFFFALSFVAFRFAYRPGSAVFGLTFYAWYDLYAAALVTQFFIATQLFFNARQAKRAYPIVIAGGSIGAVLGGSIVGLMSARVGAPNMLLVAAAVVVLFGVAIIVIWSKEDPESGRRRETIKEKNLSAGEFKRIFTHRHVLLIAAAVLLTRLIAQFVDYNYNEAVRLVGGRDAMAEFQGFFQVATQWSPIVVLVALRPLLKRWGVGIAVFMLPLVMFFTNSAVALFWGLWLAVAARGGSDAFRYSAERTAREILYVPLPDDIKLKAKAWIDVAIDKGGKVIAATCILLLYGVLGFSFSQLAAVAAGLALVSLLVAQRIRKEYVTSLAASIRGRFASLEGVYASLTDASSLPVIREALSGKDALQTAFAIDMLERAGESDLARLKPELHALLADERPQIRQRVLALLAGAPETIDIQAVRGRLVDPDSSVREAAVYALVMASDEDPGRVLSELLALDDPRIREATLVCLARGDLKIHESEPLVRAFFEERHASGVAGDSDARAELAAAAGVLPDHPLTGELLGRLITDPDARVANAALRSAGPRNDPALTEAMIDALGRPETRSTARTALEAQGDSVLEPLIARLNDETADLRVRWNIPPVLAEIPTQQTIDALIHSYILKETDQLLDDRTLKALGRLRARDGAFTFDDTRVRNAVERELSAAELYGDIRRIVESVEGDHASKNLLVRALAEAEQDRRANIFRWLGLVHPADGMYRCYVALVGTDARAKANATEWLEQTVGHRLFTRLQPIVQPPEDGRREVSQARPAMRTLWDDEDRWLARLAIRTMIDLDMPGMSEELGRFRSVDPDLERAVARLRARLDADPAATPGVGSENMDLIEKVFLLQNVDLLQVAGSAQLALLAAIADEVEAAADEVLIAHGEPVGALFVVIRGEVQLGGVGGQSMIVSDGDPFGTWALIDDEASLVEARTTQPTRLLRITRGDFHDLLVDRPELGLDLLQGLARRVRALVPGEP